MPTRHYTVEQAAEQVGVTPGRVYQWIAEGVVTPYRPHPRAILLTPADVRKLRAIPVSPVGRPRVSQKNGS